MLVQVEVVSAEPPRETVELPITNTLPFKPTAKRTVFDTVRLVVVALF